MSDLISKSELRTEIFKLNTRNGRIRRSEVLQILDNYPIQAEADAKLEEIK